MPHLDTGHKCSTSQMNFVQDSTKLEWGESSIGQNGDCALASGDWPYWQVLVGEAEIVPHC